MKNRTMFWREECQHIQDVFDNRRLKDFNNSLAVFVEYCKMQQRQAIKERFYDAAQYIDHVIGDALSALEG